MKVLGLTGGIGMGKSTVSKMFAARDVPIFDYDEVVHSLYDSGSERAEKVFRFFQLNLPEAIVNAKVDRSIVSRLAFQDAELLTKIEHEFMYHSDIMLAEWLAAWRWRTHGNQTLWNSTKLVMLDVPLLFEMGWARHCDAIAVVDCSEEIRRERVLRRPNMTEEKLDSILAKQMTREQHKAAAQFCLDTGGTLHQLADQVSELYDILN